MVSSHSFEKIAASIASLSKREAKSRLISFKGRFKLDFTEKYLDSLSADRLKHILLAAMTTEMKRN